MRHLYLRLIEKQDCTVSDAERLENARKSVEKLGQIGWIKPPSFHPRGGIQISFFIDGEPAVETWGAILDAEGYWNAV
jgi:hypothetical protein